MCATSAWIAIALKQAGRPCGNFPLNSPRNNMHKYREFSLNTKLLSPTDNCATNCSTVPGSQTDLIEVNHSRKEKTLLMQVLHSCMSLMYEIRYPPWNILCAVWTCELCMNDHTLIPIWIIEEATKFSLHSSWWWQSPSSIIDICQIQHLLEY